MELNRFSSYMPKPRLLTRQELEALIKPFGVEVVSFLPEDPPFPCNIQLKFPGESPDESLIDSINKTLAPYKISLVTALI